jgi:hypothetical protein
MAHKGKATSNVTYNSDDRLEAYNNPAIYICLHDYTVMAHEVHGPDYDPRTEEIDPDVLMRVGGGKRHVWYWIANGQSTRRPFHSVSGASKEHELEPSHTTSIGQPTSSHTTTRG